MECSRLAYGCWRITGVITHPPIDNEHEKKGHEAVIAAYEAGYTMFDLADIYSAGLAEEVFGRTLRDVSGMREKIGITTKCGIRQKGDPDKDSPHRYDLSREHIVRSCEVSLKRMGIDRIAMLKYGMSDLRQLFEGDVRWLSHYGFKPLEVPTLAGGLST